MKAGFDFGSKNISAAVIDGVNNAVAGTYCIPHNGNMPSAYENIFQMIMKDFGDKPMDHAGFTGNFEVPGIKPVDRILAVVEANVFLKNSGHSENACAIINLGSETYSLIMLDEYGNYVEHAVNPLCASGTGSFLEQQAERMGFSIEELSAMAEEFTGRTPGIATRCAVFAKSDIIHAQAGGFSREAIAAGLCEGIAGSVISNLIKGRPLSGKVVFSGGLSKSKRIVKAISEKLGIEPVMTEYGGHFGAIGAALLGTSGILKPENFSGVFRMKKDKRKKLEINLPGYPDFTGDRFYISDEVEVTEYNMPEKGAVSAYLGIDIGSTSTKSIITDAHNVILAGFYTRTKGEPVIAIQRLMKAFRKTFSGYDVKFLGTGTTGSGRKLAKSVLNADIEINEITAHAKGAVFLDRSVDTIIEIGGQDSKFTLLKDGNVINAGMNYLCAAGTGSFIEEQAQRLGVTLDEISALVSGMEAPFTTDRCTVYMERDLNIFMSEGWRKSEILASVLYSVRDNYLSKVVGKAVLGRKIFFQGATARNKALVSVFQNELDGEIVVSKYCHLTGALGVAVMLKEKGVKKSGFVGTDFKFEFTNESCALCVNKCELSIYEIDGKKTAWGLKCGREYEDRKVKSGKKINALDNKFNGIFASHSDKSHAGGLKTGTSIGIPLTLYLAEYYPLFRNFFEKMGFDVVCEKNAREKIKTGSAVSNSDFCAPLIAAIGMVDSLIKSGTDYVFFPAFISDTANNSKCSGPKTIYEKDCDDYFCYYSEYAPDIISNLPGIDAKGRLISPRINFDRNDIRSTAASLAKELAAVLKLDESGAMQTFLDCFDEFKSQTAEWKKYGKEILAGDPEKIKILFLGRPYSVFDSAVNFDIPAGFCENGFDIAYQSMLDLSGEESAYAGQYNHKMHWFYGQQILHAAEYAARRKNVYPVFLTCFRCSPDSFLLTYFRDIMDAYDKPYLVIQLDEHESDVGYTTRIEAAVETFIGDMKRERTTRQPQTEFPKNDMITNDLTVLIPYLSPVISNLQSACFEASGYKSMVLPPYSKSLNTGYKYASGSECMPLVSIAGSIIDTVTDMKLDPGKVIMYMPSSCIACNFNQFATFIRYSCKKAGLDKIKISNANTLKQLPELPKELNTNLMEAGILGSLLYKLYYRFHPYEAFKGETIKAFEDSFILIKDHMKEKKPLLKAAEEIRKMFEAVKLKDIGRKPRIGITGDLYVKYNIILNQDIYSLIEELDGEIVIPSFTETVSGILDADVRVNGLDAKYRRGLILFEKYYEKVFKGMLDEFFEPPLDECYALSREYGIMHHIPGETAINIGRILYYIKHKTVDAVVHLNPVFCCPGVVSASIFRKIQKDFNIPIIDIFYDGSNKPNEVIIPRLYYLHGQKGKNKLS